MGPKAKGIPSGKSGPIKGMFLVVDRGNPQGLVHWGDELERRGIPALIQMDSHTIENNRDVTRRLSDQGFEIGGAYNDRPLWSEPYGFQYATLSRMKDEVQLYTNRPMRVVSSKFFAYDAVTLQVADALGVDHVLARGTMGIKAVVYKPEEYKASIVSVSSVPSKRMGTGSLCDESLWCRGVAPDEFKEILFALTEERIVLVAQTHLSGVKLHWWNVYQDFLDAGMVSWMSLNEFSADHVVMPNAKIPVNTEVRYVTPQPKIPLEDEEDYPFWKA